MAGPILLLRSYELRVFSHKLGNQLQLSYRDEFCCHFSPTDWDDIQETIPKWRYIQLRDYRSLLNLKLIRILLKGKYIQGKNYVILVAIRCESEAILSKLKSFVPVTRA